MYRSERQARREALSASFWMGWALVLCMALLGALHALGMGNALFLPLLKILGLLCALDLGAMVLFIAADPAGCHRSSWRKKLWHFL